MHRFLSVRLSVTGPKLRLENNSYQTKCASEAAMNICIVMTGNQVGAVHDGTFAGNCWPLTRYTD